MADVTVITPVFNTQEYLHQYIRSVLDESRADIELILVDDGSTDDSPRIIDFYAKRDARVRVFTTPNQGQGLARNVGIESARGKYVYFFDSDDYLEPGCLSTMFRVSERHALDICAPASPGYYYERPLEFVSCLPTRMQFVRRDILEQFQVRQPNIPSGQDGVFGHLMLTHCRRFGVALGARCVYRPGRPGSTFAKYAGRPELVKSIIAAQLACVKEHYDRYELWHSQSPRFLAFLADESMRNRLGLHFDSLTADDRHEIFLMLAEVAQHAFRHLPRRFRGTLHPAVAALVYRGPEEAARVFRSHYYGGLQQPFPANFNFHNKKEQVYVCKPHWRPSARNSDYINALDGGPASTGQHLKLIEGKLDLAINTLVNVHADQRDSRQLVPLSRDKSRASPLVVSLTSLVDRLSTLHLAVESIFAQTRRPDEIVLWLSDKVEFDLDQFPRLKLATERGLTIRQVPDVGPHTKLVYAGQSFRDATIVTVDDDMIYPSTMLAVLESTSARFPGMVVANWARELPVDPEGTVCGIRRGRLLTPAAHEKQLEQEIEFAPRPSFRAFAYGTSGVLYPPGSLHERTFDFALMRELCPTEDDIWFKAMTLLTSTPVVPTNLGINPRHYSVFGSQSVALRHNNHAGGGNSIQMKNVFEYFDLYAMMSEAAELTLKQKLDHPWV